MSTTAPLEKRYTTSTTGRTGVRRRTPAPGGRLVARSILALDTLELDITLSDIEADLFYGRDD